MDDNDKESTSGDIEEAGKKADAADADRNDFVENVEKASFAKQQDKQDEQLTEKLKETTHDEEEKHKLDKTTKSLKDYNERDGCSSSSHRNDASKSSKQHTDKHRRTKDDTPTQTTSSSSSSGERNRRERRPTDYHRSSKHDTRKLSPSPSHYKSSPSEHRDSSRHGHHSRHDTHEHSSSHHRHSHGHHSQRTDKYHHKQKHSTSSRTSEHKSHNSKHSTADGNVEEGLKTNTEKTQHNVNKSPKTESSSSSTTVEVVEKMEFVEQAVNEASSESLGVKSADTIDIINKSPSTTDKSSEDLNVIEISTTSTSDTADAEQQDITNDDDKTIADSDKEQTDNDVKNTTVLEINTEQVIELNDEPMSSPKTKVSIVNEKNVVAPISNASPIISNDQSSNDGKPNETSKRPRQLSHDEDNNESTKFKRRRESDSIEDVTSDEINVPTVATNDETNVNLPDKSMDDTCESTQSEDKDNNISDDNSKALLSISEETSSSSDSTVVEVKPANESTEEDFVDLMADDSEHESNEQHDEDAVNEQSEDYSEQDIYLLGYNETGNPHIFYCENDPLRQRQKDSSVELKSPPSSPIEFMPLPSDEPDIDNANNVEQIVRQEKELTLEEETTTKSISSGMSPNLDSVSQKEGSTSPESCTALAVDLTDETVVEGVEQIVALPQTIESNRIEAEVDIVVEQQQTALNKNAEVDKFEETMMITEATAMEQTNQIVNEANTNSTAESYQLDNQEVAAAGQNDSVLDAMPTLSELQNEEQLRELGKNYVFAVVKGKLIGLPRLTRVEIWECLQNAGFKSNGIVTEDEEAIDMIEEDPKLLYKLMSKKDVEALMKQTDAETVDEANTEKRSDEHYSIIEKLQQLKQQDDAEDEDQTNEIENQTNEVENIVGVATMQQQKELQTDEVQQIEDYSFQQNETTVNDSNNDVGIADENEYNFEHLATNGKAPITLRLSPATLNQLKQYPTYFKTLRKHNHVIEEVPTEIETSTTTAITTGNESTKRSKRKRRHSGKHGKHHRRSKRSRHSTHENDISAQTTPHIVGEDNNDSDDVAMEDSTNNINENDNENLNATTLNTNESLFVTPSTSKSAQNVAAAMPATTSTKKATGSKRRLSLSTQQSVKTKQTQLSAKDDFFKKPFQYGWKRELVWRSNLDSTSKADVYFIAPNGKKFRSRSDIAPLLEGDLTIEHFCFIREPQDVGAEYELVRNAKSANRTTITPPTSTSAGLNKDSPLLVTGKRIVKPKAPKGASPPPEGWTAVRALRSNNAALTQKLPYDNDRSFSYATNERHTSSAAMQQPAPIIAPVPAPVAAASIECKLPETTSTNGTHGNYIYTSQSQPESDQGFTRQKPKPWPACDVDCERGKGEQPPLKCKLCLKRFHYACVGLKESKGKYFMKYSNEDPQLVSQEGAAYYCVPCAERFGCTRSVTEIPETETNDANAMYAHTHTQQIVVIGGKKYILNSRPPEPTEAHIQMPTEARADLKRLQKTIIFQHRGKVMPELANTPNNDDENDGDDAVSNASTITTTTTRQPAQRKDFMKNLTIGYNLLVLIMQKLPLQDCLRAGLACHLWQAATNDRRVWQCIKINDLRITNWQHFFNILRRMGTRELSLSAMLNCDNVDNDDNDNDDVWRIFMREIANVQTLRKLEMPRCPARVIESIIQSNQQLNVLKAQTIVVDDCLTLNHIGEMSNLQKLYLSPMEITNLAGDFHGLRLKELTQLSLTNFNNLHEKKISRLSMLINLRTLELGDCSLIDAQRLADVLLSMVNLRRLRIELGAVPKSEFCVLELLKVLQYLEHLKRLELINFDVKLGFDKALSKCKHLRKLLLIPTYILQSATTNNIIMNGVHSLATTLQNFTWVFTIELLRVTALYVNGDRTDDSIPILRPVPGDPDDHAEINESNGGGGGDADADDGNGDGVNEEQHVAIVTLKTVEEIMKNRMPTTNFKIVKIFYGNTLKQQLED